MRDLVYYVATSIDGFIADPDGDFSAFGQDPATLAALFAMYPETCPAHAREALGITAPPRRFDTVIMGSRTHQPALDAGLTSAYPHLRQIVVTHRDVPDDPTVETADGDVAALIRDLKARPGANLWLCGGGDLAGQLVDEIDELQVKVNPVVLGAGIPLFSGLTSPRPWRHIESRSLPAGVVLSTYRRADEISPERP